MRKLFVYLLVILFLQCFLLTPITARCTYRVLEDGTPEKVDNEPHMVEGLTQCIEYNGKLGCCDGNNDASQVTSYITIDGVFGSQGDGCDICAINLKRFWCEYACSPRQHQFMSTSKDRYPVPDPLKPGEIIYVQRVNLTVHADTACDLYNSCKRIAFVTSVSAMGSPAGFLNFQGHNAVDDAFQYIDVKFSYSKNNSLYFSDDKKEQQPQRSAFQSCNYTTSQNSTHGFPFLKNCTCNNCEDSCDDSGGFVYTESDVMEGFNFPLVFGAWGIAIAIAAVVTWRRKATGNREKNQ